MKILITGGAGFIGFNLIKLLALKKNFEIVLIDNLNSYYDLNLKLNRLSQLGFSKDNLPWKKTTSNLYPSVSFIMGDIKKHKKIEKIFKLESFDQVIHLAAQAGVRYSISNPRSYIDNNINGFFNVLECCRNFKVPKILYASSSSVYGLNHEYPSKETDRVDRPISLYAATKRSNELMAFTYSHLFNIQTIGLRFFTVYGPWGRPDMAPFIFTKNILEESEITVYNDGNSKRDFTYIDDVTESILAIINSTISTFDSTSSIYNIGNSNPISLINFINILENQLGKKANIKYAQLQPGDVVNTFANTDLLSENFNISAKVSLENGLNQFVFWYKSYYSTD